MNVLLMTASENSILIYQGGLKLVRTRKTDSDVNQNDKKEGQDVGTESFTAMLLRDLALIDFLFR